MRSRRSVCWLLGPICWTYSDLPEAGTQAFTAALTDEQRLHYNGIVTDEDKLAYQQELREQTINQQKDQTCTAVSIVRQFDVTDFSSASRPQRATAKSALFSSMNIRQIAMPQYTYLQVKTAVPGTFCRFPHRCLQTQISRTRKRSNFYVIDEGETEEGEYGFWVFDEETGEEGFTGLVHGERVSGFSALRVHTLSAASTAGPSRKVDQKVMARKEERKSRPGFRSRSKGQRFCSMGR